MLARVFVYGTLMPGHLRWPMLADVCAGIRPAQVGGTLFDTGLGWPAARFDTEGSLIPGWVVEIDPPAIDLILARLDEVENGYRRVRIRDVVGVEAWGYEVLELPHSWVAISRWSGAHER